MVTQVTSSEATERPAKGHNWIVGDWLVEPHANRLVQGDEHIVLVPKVMDVLCVLIEHAGQSVPDELFMDRVWGGAVVTDASLYQAISQLRKALGDTAKPRRYIERVSAKGYVLTASVSPRANDHTEDRRDEMPKEGSAQSNPGVRWIHNRYVIAALLVVTGVAILAGVLNRPASTTTDVPLTAINRIAVFPFQLLGNDDAPYWLNGFADTLISRLAGRQDLQVVYQNDAPESDADAAAQLLSGLDVDALLLGTVQQDQQQLRINIRVVNNKGTHAGHAEVIDGNVNNLFALQDKVALRLLSVLRPTDSTNQATPQLVDEAAWQHYLLGRFHWSKRKSDNLDLAIDHFQHSLAKEPDFVLGYVGLCDSYHFQYLYADWSLDKALSLCQPLLDKALTLNSELGQVHASLGLLAQSQEDIDKARHHLEKATELAPNYAPGWMWYGRYLRRHGEIDKALEHHRTALRLDPLSPIATRNLAFSLLASGVVNEARNMYARALELEPDYTNRPLEEIEFLPLTVNRATAFLTWSKKFDDRYISKTVNRLVKAQILLSLDDAAGANQEMASVPVDFHQHPYFLYTRGLVELALGDNEAALRSFTSRMEIESSNRQRAMPVVGVLQYMGRQTQARSRFLQSYPEFETIDDVSISADNAWLFGILAGIVEPGSATRKSVDDKISSWVARADTDDWLTVWLLSMIGDLDEASNRLLHLLETGWLPNYQEMLFPLEQDSVFAALIAHKHGAQIEQFLQRNRQSVITRYKNFKSVQ